jgi:hypothetical protein
MGKKTIRHGAVQDGGDYPAVQETVIALEQAAARESALNTAIRAGLKRKLKPLPVPAPAHDATGMVCVPQLCQVSLFLFSGHTRWLRSGVCLQDRQR